MVRRVAFAAAVALTAGVVVGAGDGGNRELVARHAVPKTPTPLLKMPQFPTGRLVIKFVDGAKARPEDEGTLSSLANHPLAQAQAILDQFGMKVSPAFSQSPDALTALEHRAARHSGKAQPDLGGIIYVDGPEPNLVLAAKALNDLDSIEWVVIEATPMIGGQPVPLTAPGREGGRGEDDRGGAVDGGAGGPAGGSAGTGACCLSNGVCVDGVDAIECIQDLGGEYLGNGTTCGAQTCVPGACCFSGGTCEELIELICINRGGGFAGAGSTCDATDCDTIECGAPGTGNCFDPMGKLTPFCDDSECCEFICGFDPICCDEDGGAWDFVCAAEANLFCDPHTRNWCPDPDDACDPGHPDETPKNDPPDGPDRCASFINFPCFEEGPLGIGGCNNQLCCNRVCDVEDFCCETQWDALCVELALQLCPSPGPGEDFEPLQGYLRRTSYDEEIDACEFPDGLEGSLPPPFFGYTGEGWNLRSNGEPFTDQNGNNWRDEGEPFEDVGRDGIPCEQDPACETCDEGEGNNRWEPPGGLWGVAEQLLRAQGVDGTGKGNLTLGKTTKVAVIEWSMWDEHEDLDVTVEPGQTLIKTREFEGFINHGTACMSIINAKDDGRGVRGIVPQAKGFFFPLTSIEEGPRFQSVWISAMSELGPGDTISNSWGTADNSLNTVQNTWTMIRLASDLGITVLIAAGNSCFNLDDADDFGQSGGIVVGACSPGEPWYRLSFSNYCTDPSLDRGNIVHVKAWGDAVTAAGYGDLVRPPNGDMNRSYTNNFNGTSAAAPQVAGLAAALQGLAKQFYGIPLSPEQIQSVLGAPGIPPENPPRLFGGFDPSQGCGLDYDPDLGPNMIGPYPAPPAAANRMLSQDFPGFGDAPLVDDVAIVRGTDVAGTKWSIKGRENIFLGLDALYTDRHSRPVGGVGRGNGIGGGIPVPEIERIRYIISGMLTDIVVVGHADVDEVNTMILENEMAWPNVFSLLLVEAYDWRRQKFVFADLAMTPPEDFAEFITDDGQYIFHHEFQAPQRFARLGDNRILIRLWTIGFTFSGIDGPGGDNGGDATYRPLYDLLNIFVSDQFGEELP